MPDPVLHVMHIDDGEDDRFLVAHTVDQLPLPLKLSAASSGREALKVLGEPSGLPQMILLDVKMAEMSGLEVLETLKRDVRLSSILVIMLSSSTFDRDIDTARRLGADSYCFKPASLTGYQEILTELYNAWRNSAAPSLWPPSL